MLIFGIEGRLYAGNRPLALVGWTSAPGHELPVVVPADQPLERPLQSETCRTAYARNSATAAISARCLVRRLHGALLPFEP